MPIQSLGNLMQSKQSDLEKRISVLEKVVDNQRREIKALVYNTQDLIKTHAL